jgi:phosphoribosylformylglycinamidine synthase
VSAAHDLSDGGLGVALAEMAIGGDMGAAVDLESVSRCPAELGPEEILYSESASRFLVTVPPQSQKAFESFFAGQHCALLGEVRKEPELQLSWRGGRYLSESVASLKSAWQGTMDW